MWTSEQADPAGSFPVEAETDTKLSFSCFPSTITAETNEKVHELCDQTVLMGCWALQLSSCRFLSTSQRGHKNACHAHVLYKGPAEDSDGHI